jgi:putative peptidoglycan lipid II flippase
MSDLPARGSIAKSAGIMAIATSMSRIMGLVREQSFAYLFGAGVWTDAFNVAFLIPNLLRNLFAEGAMSAAFVPVFNSVLKQEGKERAFRLTNLVLSVLLVILGAITCAGVYFSPGIVGVLAPEFRAVPQKFETTVLMTRIMFPFLLAVSWAAILMGILNSLGKFFLPAFAPVLLNLAMIIAGFTLCPLSEGFGYPAIVGMAVGAMIGGFLQMGIQLWPLRQQGFRLRWAWNTADSQVRRIAALVVPGTVGSAATQINVAISTFLATSQGTGAVSWLGYAFRLMQLPLGIFGVAIAQATLPVISRQAADNDRAGMAQTLAGSLKLSGFINIAATTGLISLAEPIIRLVFEHGRFTAADTLATTQALRAYAVGLVFFSLIKVLSPAFFALNDTKTPVNASLLSVATNIVLNISLIGPCGYWGLPLGTSLAAGINSLFLFVRLRSKLPDLAQQGIRGAFWRSLIAAGVGGVCMKGLFDQCVPRLATLLETLPGSMISDALGILLAGTAGIVVILLTAGLLGLEEAGKARTLLLSKLLRRRISG